MTKKITLLLSVWALSFLTPAQETLQRVVLSYSSQSYAFTLAQAAIEKGFFKEEGLEPVMV